MISDKDANFYHENGYIVVDDVYSMSEVEAMRAVVEELVEKSREVSGHNDILTWSLHIPRKTPG